MMLFDLLLLAADIWDTFGLSVEIGLKNLVKQALFKESLNYLDRVEQSLFHSRARKRSIF